MTYKKRISVRLGLLLVVVALIGIFANIQPVFAKIGNDGWCESTSNLNDSNDNCLIETWKKMPDDLKKQFGDVSKTEAFKKFSETAKSCVKATPKTIAFAPPLIPIPLPLDPLNGYAAPGGSCANAVLYCYTHAMNTGGCNENNAIQRIAIGCNDGKDTNQRGCDPVKDINKSIVESFDNEMQELADGTCTPKDGEDDLTALNRCKAAMADVRKYCGDQSRQPGFESPLTTGGADGDSEYKLADQDAYRKCLETEIVNRAANKPECDGRVGFWVEEKNAGNGVEGNHCYEDYSKLQNANACAASGTDTRRTGVWAQEKGKTGDDGWGCHPPSDVCDGKGGVKAEWKVNDLEPCQEPNLQKDEGTEDDRSCPINPDTNDCAAVAGTTKQCGNARVNLLGCGTDTGAAAFTAILKIIIIVLTTLVGIAAVGGLAYASLTYARAEDDSGTVSQAKTLIRNIVIGIVLYGFLIAIVTWLVPGLSLT